MNYTKEYCEELLQKVIDDLDEQRGGIYYDKETPFEAYYCENDKNLYSEEIIKHAWRVYAEVPKEEFWLGGRIIIHVDDDTGEALTFVNTALGGRPLFLPLKINENGNYYIPKEVLPS
ncbi:MAG: hypothetical protein ACI8ZM_000060 [Crocinitomix sp.]|jgi:hypothetical protein